MYIVSGYEFVDEVYDSCGRLGGFGGAREVNFRTTQETAAGKLVVDIGAGGFEVIGIHCGNALAGSWPKG